MRPKCTRHPLETVKLLRKPPYTASRKVDWLDGTRDCDHINYWKCPKCGTCYATPKESAST